jgi:hypothetical protein
MSQALGFRWCEDHVANALRYWVTTRLAFTPVL